MSIANVTPGAGALHFHHSYKVWIPGGNVWPYGSDDDDDSLTGYIIPFRPGLHAPVVEQAVEKAKMESAPKASPERNEVLQPLCAIGIAQDKQVILNWKESTGQIQVAMSVPLNGNESTAKWQRAYRQVARPVPLSGNERTVTIILTII